jgi:uncharacterized protein YjbJ (UPF0337 family)
MQSTETMQMPALGEAGEPCAGCGAPLAADQRYCLNCGQRRAGPRVDYRRYLAPAGGEAPSPPPPEEPTATATQEPSKPERDYAPLAAVGGIAVLGLMLLVGVLIGKGNGTTATTPAPVIKVPTVAGTTSSEAAPQEASSGSKRSKGKEKKVDTGAKSVAGGLTGDAASNAEGTVQASEGDLEALNNTSGESYQDAVKKLPDKIATPGRPRRSTNPRRRERAARRKRSNELGLGETT